jgi:GGDEF domain-containing protein
MKSLEFSDALQSGQLSEEFQYLLDKNPLGILFLDRNYEIAYTNEQLDAYFLNDLDLSSKKFGNMFHCEFVANSGELCGSTKQCGNCKMRNSAVKSKENGITIKNVRVKRSFNVRNTRATKWLDMTFAPMRIGKNEFTWVSILDLTQLMHAKYSKDHDLKETDEDFALSKDFFHENVIKSLAVECDDDTGVYMIMMSIKEELRSNHRFGYIWKDEIINNYKEQVENILGESGQFCRYSQDRFLVYLHCKHEKDIQEFIKRQSEYKSLLFHLKNIFDFKIMKLKINPDRIMQLSEENRLYIEYFKAITKLERSKEKEMIVEVL